MFIVFATGTQTSGLLPGRVVLFCWPSVSVVGSFGDSRFMQVHDHGHINSLCEFQLTGPIKSALKPSTGSWDFKCLIVNQVCPF